jgi:hypothetical protein
VPVLRVVRLQLIEALFPWHQLRRKVEPERLELLAALGE